MQCLRLLRTLAMVQACERSGRPRVPPAVRYARRKAYAPSVQLTTRAAVIRVSSVEKRAGACKGRPRVHRAEEACMLPRGRVAPRVETRQPR